MKGTALRTVSEALASVGRPVRHGRASCPAHNGDGQNLSVRQGRLGVVLHCHSRGCTAHEIAQAVGLGMTDLFDEPREPMHFPPTRFNALARCISCAEQPVPSPGAQCERCKASAADEQTDDALAIVDDDAQPLVWPFASLRAIAPPIPNGHVVVVAASSGGGKSTFVWSVVQAWAAAGVRGYILPLETRPDEWRAAYAAIRCGINPGYLVSGALRMAARSGDTHAQAQRAAIRAELERLRDDRSVVVGGARAINTVALERAFEHACQAEADYMLIDHIDHVGSDQPSRDDLKDGREVVGRMHDMALQYGMPVIATSQLNNQRFLGGKLGKYAPPQVNWLWNPAKKEQVATQILGLYRPLRASATPAELQAVRDDRADVLSVLEPGRSGVAVLKLRHAFAPYREGARGTLVYDDGVLRDPTPAEARGDARDRHVPLTLPPLTVPRLAPTDRERRGVDSLTLPL